MAAAANPADDPADAEALERYAAALVAAVEVALPAWVQRMVAARWTEQRDEELPEPVQQATRDAAAAAAEEVLPPLRALLAEDVAAQRSNPLSLVRRAVVHPTRVLTAAGIAPADRDEEARRLFPDDVYDLVPASFADLDESVVEPGIAWGAAKAHVLLRRRAGEADDGTG